MNSSQRRLVLVALIAVAIGFHFWNLRWDYREWQPYYGVWQLPGRFATVQWSTEPDIPGYFSGWGPATSKDSGYDIFREWHTWGVQMWGQYELAGRPLPWLDYLRANSRATHYLGLWMTGSEEDAWLWGIFAPLGALTLATYLVLGWRKPTDVPQPAAAADDRPHAGARG